jgi:hypothetical protein
MKNISKNKTGNGNKAQAAEESAKKSKKKSDTTLKAGSELDRVCRAVMKHPGLTISGVGKALRWKYGPGRALKKLVKMGLLTLDKKTKTFTAVK